MFSPVAMIRPSSFPCFGTELLLCRGFYPGQRRLFFSSFDCYLFFRRWFFCTGSWESFLRNSLFAAPLLFFCCLLPVWECTLCRLFCLFFTAIFILFRWM